MCDTRVCLSGHRVWKFKTMAAEIWTFRLDFESYKYARQWGMRGMVRGMRGMQGMMRGMRGIKK